MEGTIQHYVLLDGAQIDDFLPVVYQLEPNPEFYRLYDKTHYAELADAGPIMVYTDRDSSLMRHFEQYWSSTAGVIVRSAAPINELVEHLRSLVHVRVTGGATLLFRYYDPRILALWLTDTPERERSTAMGPVSEFRLLTANDWHSVANAGTNPPRARRYDDIPWLQLSDDQLVRLNQAKLEAFEQRLLQHVDSWFPDCLARLNTAERKEWAKACCVKANDYGFNAAADVTRWAGFTAMLGPGFPDTADHRAYRTLLKQTGMSPSHKLDAIKAEIQRVALTQNTDGAA